MVTTARLYSIFLLLIAVGTFIAGLSDAAKMGAGGILGAFLVPVIIGLPTVSALIALGKNKPKAETFSLFVNKAYLFLCAATAIGFVFKSPEGPSRLLTAWLVSGSLFALSFLLNAIALQKQRNKRQQSASA